MKKGLKIAGTIAGIAALASLIPYSVSKDQENDETTVHALLWKYTNKPDHEAPGSRKVSVDIGFHNPFAAENDDLLMDDDCDEPLLDCSPAVEAEPAPAGEAPAQSAESEATEADFAPEL